MRRCLLLSAVERRVYRFDGYRHEKTSDKLVIAAASSKNGGWLEGIGYITSESGASSTYDILNSEPAANIQHTALVKILVAAIKKYRFWFVGEPWEGDRRWEDKSMGLKHAAATGNLYDPMV